MPKIIFLPHIKLYFCAPWPLKRYHPKYLRGQLIFQTPFKLLLSRYVLSFKTVLAMHPDCGPCRCFSLNCHCQKTTLAKASWSPLLYRLLIVHEVTVESFRRFVGMKKHKTGLSFVKLSGIFYFWADCRTGFLGSLRSVNSFAVLLF